jgi:exodeoxyribonuclease VII large subunit
VRAVVDSRIPVVTGVGHEIDFTLVDFAADQRAPTPSAAAELVTPDGPAYRQQVDLLTAQLAATMQAWITEQRGTLASSARLLIQLSPRHMIHNARQRVDDLALRLDTRVRQRIERQRDRLAAHSRALESANPAALLERGYALVTRAGDGQRVTSIRHAAEGTRLHITLRDGRLTAEVRQRDAGDTQVDGG